MPSCSSRPTPRNYAYPSDRRRATAFPALPACRSSPIPCASASLRKTVEITSALSSIRRFRIFKGKSRLAKRRSFVCVLSRSQGKRCSSRPMLAQGFHSLIRPRFQALPHHLHPRTATSRATSPSSTLCPVCLYSTARSVQFPRPDGTLGRDGVPIVPFSPPSSRHGPGWHNGESAAGDRERSPVARWLARVRPPQPGSPWKEHGCPCPRDSVPHRHAPWCTAS